MSQFSSTMKVCNFINMLSPSSSAFSVSILEKPLSDMYFIHSVTHSTFCSMHRGMLQKVPLCGPAKVKN